MNGLDIVRRVYTRLRKPSQEALPYQTVLETVGEVWAMRKLDLALSPHNSLASISDWFTPTESDFSMEELGVSVLLPVRVETRTIGSELETGLPVPIVNFDVLDKSIVGAVAFYGTPMRMAFRDTVDYIGEQEYRLVYEGDLEGQNTLAGVSGLPDYFTSLIVLEAAYELREIVEDSSPEWADFMKHTDKYWPGQIADKRQAWERYVQMFKGRAQVPKRTFFDNHSVMPQERRFRS